MSIYHSNLSYSGNLSTSANLTVTSVGYRSVSNSDEDLVEFINFAFEIIGVDISYQKFKEMSREERKSFLREIKLNKIL
jgi:hypothetical protein